MDTEQEKAAKNKFVQAYDDFTKNPNSKEFAQKFMASVNYLVPLVGDKDNKLDQNEVRAAADLAKDVLKDHPQGKYLDSALQKAQSLLGRAAASRPAVDSKVVPPAFPTPAAESQTSPEIEPHTEPKTANGPSATQKTPETPSTSRPETVVQPLANEAQTTGGQNNNPPSDTDKNAPWVFGGIAGAIALAAGVLSGSGIFIALAIAAVAGIAGAYFGPMIKKSLVLSPPNPDDVGLKNGENGFSPTPEQAKALDKADGKEDGVVQTAVLDTNNSKGVSREEIQAALGPNASADEVAKLQLWLTQKMQAPILPNDEIGLTDAKNPNVQLPTAQTPSKPANGR